MTDIPRRNRVGAAVVVAGAGALGLGLLVASYLVRNWLETGGPGPSPNDVAAQQEHFENLNRIYMLTYLFDSISAPVLFAAAATLVALLVVLARSWRPRGTGPELETDPGTDVDTGLD